MIFAPFEAASFTAFIPFSLFASLLGVAACCINAIFITKKFQAKQVNS
jgi:hypothetical protein